jgi:hypothetical protein
MLTPGSQSTDKKSPSAHKRRTGEKARGTTTVPRHAGALRARITGGGPVRPTNSVGPKEAVREGSVDGSGGIFDRGCVPASTNSGSLFTASLCTRLRLCLESDGSGGSQAGQASDDVAGADVSGEERVQVEGRRWWLGSLSDR